MSFLTSEQSRQDHDHVSPRDMTRARTGVALVTSLLLHALVTLNWGPAAQPSAPAAAEARNGEIVFLPMSAPPIRQPRIVVVGPETTGHGGSRRGRAPESAGPRVARRERLSPAYPSMPTELPPGSLADQATRDTPGDFVAPVASAEPSRPGSPVTMTAGPDRTFDDLVQAQTLWLAAGRGEGRGGFGRGGGPPGLALSLDVSGRRVAGSHVVAAPVVLEQQRITCELPSGRLRAVVRLLVMRDGTGAAPRMLESSGQRSFDECAVRYAQGLRFAPGVDGAGRPLDVWVHVGITPAVTKAL
jgi:hypothetical protein